jgi:cytochrome P450 family 6
MDPKLIKNVLVRDFEHFQDRGFQFDEKVDPLVANWFVLNDEKRKNFRCKLSPTLTSGKMKMMFQNLLDCGQELGKYYEEPVNAGCIIEVKEVLARFTTDVIASCAFGIQCNCLRDPNAECRQWVENCLSPQSVRTYEIFYTL